MRIPEILSGPPDISFSQAGLLNVSKKDEKEVVAINIAQERFEKERNFLDKLALMIKGGTGLLVLSGIIVFAKGLSEQKPDELIAGGGLFLAALGVLSRYKSVDDQKGIREVALEDIQNLTE